MTKKYRTQRRITFSPFLLHVQPSTKVSVCPRTELVEDHMNISCIQNSLNLQKILFPVQWNPYLTPRIAKTFAITTELKNTVFSLYSIYFCKIDTSSQPVKTGKKAPKLLIEKNPKHFVLPALLRYKQTSNAGFPVFSPHSPHVYENMYLFP